MWSVKIEVDTPGFDDLAGLGEPVEQMLVETFVAQPSIKTLDEGVLGGLARCDVVPFDTAVLSPFEDGVAGHFGSIVRDDRLWAAVERDKAIQFASEAQARDRVLWQGSQGLHDRPESELTLVSVNRRPEDALFALECEQLAEAHIRFRFVPTMTAATNWDGETGRISLELLLRYVPDLRRAFVHVSGLEGMVASTLRILRNAGLPVRQIKSEQFGAFSGVHPTHRKTSNRLLWLSGGVVAIGLHAAVIYSLSGHLQTALTWDLWTGLAVVLVAAALLFLKLFLILKHRH
jgi:hypothetical protein